MKNIRKVLAAGCLAIPMMFSGEAAKAIAVDVELQLLIDVSGSVDTSEYNLMVSGYEAAFQDASVQAAITSTAGGDIGGIAVQVIQWSSFDQQEVSIDWVHVDSAADANALATSIGSMTREFSGGGTAVADAINFAFPLFDGNGFEADRQVMDIQGDGVVSPPFSGADQDVAGARDAAIAAGVDRINAIAVGDAVGLTTFYRDEVIGRRDAEGVPPAFLMFADDFGTVFADAILAKIEGEAGETVPPGAFFVLPEPGPVAIFGLGLLVLGAYGRRRRNLAEK